MAKRIQEFNRLSLTMTQLNYESQKFSTHVQLIPNQLKSCISTCLPIKHFYKLEYQEFGNNIPHLITQLSLLIDQLCQVKPGNEND